jgi:hypothetical protein
MVDEAKFNIRKAIEEGSQHTTLSHLQNAGVRNVKVLDENMLQEMIARAVDQVISTETREERSRILADSRKQLQKLLSEKDQAASKANLLEQSKNELVRQIERLQAELEQARSAPPPEDEGVKARLQDSLAREITLQKRTKELEDENAWLRGEHDRMVEELDRALAEIKRLKAELEALQAGADDGSKAREDADALRKELDGLRFAREAEQEELQTLRAGADAGHKSREEAEALRAELAKLEEALAEAESDREELRGKVREASESAAARESEAQQRLKESEEELERLRAAVPPAPIEEVEVIEEPPPPPPPPPPPAKSVAKPGKGLDVGTVNLVAAEQNEAGDVELRLQRNVFIDVEITAYTKAMLTRLQVPYVVQGKKMFVMGEPAFRLANVLNRNTRRPMKDGLISPKEQDALPIMKMLIGSILGEPRAPMEVCFYSVPGDPVDSDLSVAYHRDLFDAVLKSLGYKPSHIIEGHAVTFAELGEEDFTGIGVSCGGGMFNICVAYKSMPALTFSTARSGDWVDANVAQVLGIKPAKAAMIKEQGVDLMAPKNREEDAVAIYYRNLIKYNLTNIAERFRAAENMPTFPEPISMVFSGGTSMAGNFIELVRDVFKTLEFPIPIKEVRLAKDPLNATAKGALVAAQLEMASKAS